MNFFLDKRVRKVLDHATIGLFLAIVVTFSLLSPQFFSLQNFINIFIQASGLAIIATGMTFVLLTAGIDLSVGSVMFLAGVVSGKLVVLGGQPLWLACLVVLAVGVAYGFVNAVFIYRLRVVPFIVTLATFYIGRGLGLLISETRAINLPETFLQIGAARLLGVPLPIVVLMVVIIAGQVMLSYTTFGRQIYAVGHNAEKARKAGLPVKKILRAVYMISGFCAALGGLVGHCPTGGSFSYFWPAERIYGHCSSSIGWHQPFRGQRLRVSGHPGGGDHDPGYSKRVGDCECRSLPALTHHGCRYFSDCADRQPPAPATAKTQAFKLMK